jgi:hypothetical protein
MAMAVDSGAAEPRLNPFMTNGTYVVAMARYVRATASHWYCRPRWRGAPIRTALPTIAPAITRMIATSRLAAADTMK